MAESASRFSAIHHSGQFLLCRNPEWVLGENPHGMVEGVRTDAGRNTGTSYAIIDSQSVKTTSAAAKHRMDEGKNKCRSFSIQN